MKMLSKIKLLKEIKIQAKNIFYYMFVFLVFLNINNVYAASYLDGNSRNCRSIDAMQKELNKIKNYYISNVSNKAEIESQLNKVISVYQTIISTCEKINKSFPTSMSNINTAVKEEHWYGDKKYTEEEYQKLFDDTMFSLSQDAEPPSMRNTAVEYYKEYETSNKNFGTELKKLFEMYEATGGSMCGEDNPFGCPTGLKCYTCGGGGGNGTGGASWAYAKCSKKKPGAFGDVCSEVESAGKLSFQVQSWGGLAGSSRMTIRQDKSTETVEQNALGFDKNHTETNMFGERIEEPDPRSNAGFCDIKGLKESYMGNCYSCTIVAALISTFMDVADKTAPLTQQAGVRLMIIGMFLWIAFYVLKQMASLVMPEPMKMVQDLLKFFFKCLIAYTLITSGISVVSKMIVEPLLSFGAEYGNTIIDVTTPKIADIDKYGKFDTKDYNSHLISEAIFGKIMTLSKKADAAVSLNFVIGDALACHAHHAGAITVAKKVQEILHIEFYFPDFWLWLCGIAIWFMGLMVVIGINFYLLDLSFKVGFGLLALPITLGLWPFDKFQNKFTECIKLIINAAGTFMFLGISVGITVTLISAALGGTDELFKAIENDNKRYVAEQFSLGGAKFLLVAFAFFYSHKLISETVSNLTDTFFGSSLAGGMNHMHTMTVGTTSYLGGAVKDKVGGTVGRITKGIGKGADALTETAMGGAMKGLKKGGRAIGRLASKLK